MGCLRKSDVGLEAKYLYVFALYAIHCSSFKVGGKRGEDPIMLSCKMTQKLNLKPTHGRLGGRAFALLIQCQCGVDILEILIRLLHMLSGCLPKWQGDYTCWGDGCFQEETGR